MLSLRHAFVEAMYPFISALCHEPHCSAAPLPLATWCLEGGGAYIIQRMPLDKVRAALTCFKTAVSRVLGKLPYLRLPHLKTGKEALFFAHPLIIPMQMAVMVAAIEFGPDLQRAVQGIQEHLQGGSGFVRLLRLADEAGRVFLQFLFSSAKGIAVAMLTVDVWALSVVFSARGSNRDRDIYVLPVMGLLAHFMCVALVVSLTAGVDAFSAEFVDLATQQDSATVGDQTDANQGQDGQTKEPESGIHGETLAIISMGLPVFLLTFVAVYIGWCVRCVMWSDYESLPDGAGSSSHEA